MNITKQIAIMQSYNNGNTPIESRLIGGDYEWELDSEPTWNWDSKEYRTMVTKETKRKNALRDLDIGIPVISFGIIEGNKDGTTRLVFDTHIRTTMYDALELGDVATFGLVPINKASLSISEKILENPKAKGRSY